MQKIHKQLSQNATYRTLNPKQLFKVPPIVMLLEKKPPHLASLARRLLLGRRLEGQDEVSSDPHLDFRALFRVQYRVSGV